jgi:hypothetical protein
MILNNYSGTDGLASIARIAVTLSLLGSYPLAFQSVRDGMFELLSLNGKERYEWNAPVVAVGLFLVTMTAFVVKDIGIILSLGGATLGNALMYVLPAFMIVRGSKTYPVLAAQVPAAVCLGTIGVALGTIGVAHALGSVLMKSTTS